MYADPESVGDLPDRRAHLSFAGSIRRAGKMVRLVVKATRFWFVNGPFTLTLGLIGE